MDPFLFSTTADIGSERDPYHEYFDLTIWIPIFVFTLIGFSLLLFVVIYSCCKFNSVKMVCKIKAYSLLGLLCFLAASIFFLLYAINAKFAFGRLNKVTMSFWSIYNSCWSLGYLFTYLLLYERQKTIFSETMYRMSRCQSVTFFIFLIAYFVAQQILSGAWMLFVMSDAFSWAEFIWPYYGCLGTKLVIDLIMNVFLVHLFCSNILKLTVRTRASVQQSGHAFRHNHSHRVWKVMIKHFVLSCFTIGSTLLYTASELILSVSIEVASDTGHYTFYRWWYCVYFVLCNVDSIVSSLFVLLSFSFTNAWYNKCCRRLNTK